MLAEGTFDGKVALVTGGGSGLGRAFALEFARLGAGVVVAGRRPEPLDETVGLIGDNGAPLRKGAWNTRPPSPNPTIPAPISRSATMTNSAAR